MQKLKDKRSVEQIANEIFFKFELNQSVAVYGYEAGIDETLEIKGMAVVKELERLDVEKNYISDGKKMRRRRVKPANSIGAFIADKTFKFKQDTVDGIPRVSIWRIQ